uniref:Cytochrome c oxidase subunit 3 n=1 Tax=Salpa younti TaxID=2072449 RepID=A0AA86J2R0_9UROC|nr:cytochrome c oxidase subunit III [Salpa younti]
MSHTNFNRGHFIVNPSHAPFLFAVALFCVGEGLIMMLKGVGTIYMMLPLLITGVFMCSEMIFLDYGGMVGDHTRSRYMVSFYWLVAAEAFAFFSLLFSWFSKGTWAPALGISGHVLGAELPSAMGLGLLNSALLLSSSVTVTYSHMSLSMGSEYGTSIGLMYTIVLGCLFLGVQWVEFSESSMSISDGFYGSMLFASLGFHGMHVLVGVLFLLVALWRVKSGNSTPSTHPTYLCSVIYWHFVDVVWVFVYFSYYLAL